MKSRTPILALILCLTLLGASGCGREASSERVSRSLSSGDFIDLMLKDKVATVDWTGETVAGRLRDGQTFRAVVPKRGDSGGDVIERVLRVSGAKWTMDERRAPISFPSPFRLGSASSCSEDAAS
jgi:hypothetical protein